MIFNIICITTTTPQPFYGPTNSVKALKATSAFGSGRRC